MQREHNRAHGVFPDAVVDVAATIITGHTARIRQCMDELPSGSIIGDMSHYEKAENLSKTRKLASCVMTKGSLWKLRASGSMAMKTGLQGLVILKVSR